MHACEQLLEMRNNPGRFEGARLHAREVALGAVGEHREHLVHARGVAAELEHVLIAGATLESTTVTNTKIQINAAYQQRPPPHNPTPRRTRS